MADKQLSALTAASALDVADLLLVSQGGNSRKATVAQIAAAVAASSAGWRLAGAGQTVAGIWDQAVDGTKATVDFNALAGYGEIMVIARNITLSVSGIPVLQVSVNDGSSYYSASGDYITISAGAGVESASTGLSLTNLAATAVRSGVGIVQGANVGGVPKVLLAPVRESTPRYFVASTNDVDAVRIVPSAGGNITGGVIYCLVR